MCQYLHALEEESKICEVWFPHIQHVLCERAYYVNQSAYATKLHRLLPFKVSEKSPDASWLQSIFMLNSCGLTAGVERCSCSPQEVLHCLKIQAKIFAVTQKKLQLCSGRRKEENMNSMVDGDRNEISSKCFWEYGQKYRRLRSTDNTD